MLTDNQVRIDKWLWAVRIFKTREQAAEACRKGRVLIGENHVKPSRILKTGEIILVRKNPVCYSFRVKGLLAKRLSARLVGEYMEDITPASELEKLHTGDSFYVIRDRGAGRPTKKERRLMNKIQGHRF